MKNNKLLLSMSIDAMFLALIALFSYVPYLGYINIGPISFTTIHLLVLVGALFFGKTKGAIYGLFMGIFSLLICIQYPGTVNYFFLNPFVSVLPRVIFGFLSGLIFDILRKKLNFKSFLALSAPICGLLTLFHTLITLSSLYIFGVLDIFKITSLIPGYEDIMNGLLGMFSTFWNFLLLFVAPGAVCETAAAIIISPAIMGALYNVVIKSNFVRNGLVTKFENENKIKIQYVYFLIAVCLIITIILCGFIIGNSF